MQLRIHTHSSKLKGLFQFWNTVIAKIIGVILALLRGSDTWVLYLPTSSAVTLLVPNTSKPWSEAPPWQDFFMSAIFSRPRRKKKGSNTKISELQLNWLLFRITIPLSLSNILLLENYKCGFFSRDGLFSRLLNDSKEHFF